MEVIIEQLGASHNVIERQRFDQNRIDIGRSYANDVILTDEHVDAFHARLDRSEDGHWQLSDRDSTNGLKKHGVRDRADAWQVESGDIYSVGRSKIRIFMADHPVPAATPIRHSELFLLYLGRWPVLATLFVTYLAIAYFRFYINSTTELEWRHLISIQIRTTLTYLFLVVGVYLLSVLFKRSGHFLSHLGVLALVAVVVSAANGVMKILWFNTPDGMDDALRLMQSVIDRGALFAYFWCVLYLAFHLSMKSRTLISAALIGMILLTTFLQKSQWRDHNHHAKIQADWSMLPPSLLFRAPVSETDYFDQAFKVFDEADKERERLQQENE